MVEELRNKWCEDLEDILQCPICLTCAINVSIYQCTLGHLICEPCKEKIDPKLCPLCKNVWTSYRNRLAEDLCLKFDDIKESLIDPIAEINKLSIPDKVCTATQTDSVKDAPAVAPDHNAIERADQFKDGHCGTYPCCVGGCEAKLGFEALIVHTRFEHSLRYQELPSQGDPIMFTHVWNFDYRDDLSLDWVFDIEQVGTFVLKLWTDRLGNLSGYVVMIHNGFVSKQFTYSLSINGTKDISFYTDTVNSCRASPTILEDKCLRVKIADVHTMNADDDGMSCRLTLYRNLQLNDVLPRMNRRNRKRAKNGRKAD